MDFKSIDELQKYLQAQIDSVLDKEVAEAVKDEIVMAVDSTVYDAGEPEVYERRGLSPTSEGLGGKSQMHHTVKDGVLEVTDDAKAKDDYWMYLAEDIEYGYGTRKEWWNRPRPFMETAKDNLESNGYHIERMKEGLEKRGINCE